MKLIKTKPSRIVALAFVVVVIILDTIPPDVF